MIPRTIIAGPYLYEVTERHVDSDEANGMTDVDRQTVTISPTITEDRKAMVVAHEWLHVIWDLAGIDEKVNEEHVVTRLAPHLLDGLRRNPTLVAYLAASR